MPSVAFFLSLGRLPPSFALFFQITYPPLLPFSSQCSPNRRAFVLPLFLFLFGRLLPVLSVLLPRYSGLRFILSVVQTYFQTHRHSNRPPRSSTRPRAPPRRASCSVPLINSPIPCLQRNVTQFKRAEVTACCWEFSFPIPPLFTSSPVLFYVLIFRPNSTRPALCHSPHLRLNRTDGTLIISALFLDTSALKSVEKWLLKRGNYNCSEDVPRVTQMDLARLKGINETLEQTLRVFGWAVLQNLETNYR